MSEHLQSIDAIRRERQVDTLVGPEREMWEILLLDIAPEAKYAALVTAMLESELPSGTPIGLALAKSGLLDDFTIKSRGDPRPKKARRHLTPYRREEVPLATRREVYARDKNACLKCGSRRRLSLDHIIPVTSGGDNSIENLRTLCIKCNIVKSATMEAV